MTSIHRIDHLGELCAALLVIAIRVNPQPLVTVFLGLSTTLDDILIITAVLFCHLHDPSYVFITDHGYPSM